MSASRTQALDQVPTGNTFDKYGSSNPVVRRLMAGFQASLDDLLEQAAPESVLDIGCGEGVLTAQWAQRLAPRRVSGLDLPDPKLAEQWDQRLAEAAPGVENLEFRTGSAESLPLGDGAYDLVAAIETLEHVSDPELVLHEMVRVARTHLLASVPREPLWRALNLARGAYVRALGNTPGHLNHWSRGGFVQMLERHGEVVSVRTPFPWTMALLRVR
jgi:2-polyprenyl-3-methyl-5-hydroxy-6-metoxy-1,4-benzoquinol methylase